MMTTMDPVEALERFGCAVLPSVLPNDECERMAEALDVIEQRKRHAGETRSMTDSQVVIYCVDLLNPDVFLPCINVPAITDVASKLLSGPFILSSCAASRSGPRGGSRAHIDGRMPLRHASDTTHVSAVICLDDFTEANGAIRFWPMSHTTGSVPPKGVEADELPGKIDCEAKRGSVVFFLGSTWHEVGRNRNGNRRWGLIVTYCRWWVKPTYDYTRCGPEFYARLTARQKELYGFTSRPPGHEENRDLTLTRVEDLPERYPV